VAQRWMGIREGMVAGFLGWEKDGGQKINRRI
jgi:hypothetical protein